MQGHQAVLSPIFRLPVFYFLLDDIRSIITLLFLSYSLTLLFPPSPYPYPFFPSSSIFGSSRPLSYSRRQGRSRVAEKSDKSSPSWRACISGRRLWGLGRRKGVDLGPAGAAAVQQQKSSSNAAKELIANRPGIENTNDGRQHQGATIHAAVFVDRAKGPHSPRSTHEGSTGRIVIVAVISFVVRNVDLDRQWQRKCWWPRKRCHGHERHHERQRQPRVQPPEEDELPCAGRAGVEHKGRRE